MNENITMIVSLPKEWCLIKREQAKNEGKIWSTFARQKIVELCMNDIKKPKTKAKKIK